MKNNISILCTFCIIIMSLSFNNAIAATKSTKNANSNNTVAEVIVEEKVNINNANEEKLINLPGIGPKMAVRISDYRKVNGPFKSIDDLLNVKGIGPKVLEKIRPFVKVS